jgi:hypothetical protein
MRGCELGCIDDLIARPTSCRTRKATVASSDRRHGSRRHRRSAGDLLGGNQVSGHSVAPASMAARAPGQLRAVATSWKSTARQARRDHAVCRRRKCLRARSTSASKPLARSAAARDSASTLSRCWKAAWAWANVAGDCLVQRRNARKLASTPNPASRIVARGPQAETAARSPPRRRTERRSHALGRCGMRFISKARNCLLEARAAS